MKLLSKTLKSKYFINMILIICLCVTIYSGYEILKRSYDSYINKQINNEMSDEFDNILKNLYKNRQKADPFGDLVKKNKDIKGWIHINNTNINYVMLQTDNNDFYLKHDINKKDSPFGAIFADYRNDLKTNENLKGQNLILYGHHMKNGTMFTDLKKFRDKNFFENNTVIELYIFPYNYKFKIFSVLLVNKNLNYTKNFFSNDKEINEYLKEIKKDSIQFRDVKLTDKDTILTLSTCAYDFKDARLVVQGKLINF